MQRNHYEPMPQLTLAGTHCRLADLGETGRVRMDSSAYEVMTDLRRIPAATIDGATPLPQAHQAMMLRGVRMLLVTDESGRVLGLITAVDLLGERPLQVGQARGMPFGELTVAQVMTPLEQLEAVALADVMRAEVGHIVATLRRAGRQHALVLEEGGVIRGIFSSSQIARQLGEPLHTPAVARTFAEIEAAIA